MGKEKHEPKDSKKKFQISDDAEKTLVGLMLIIIALIGLLNKGIVGEFLTYSFVYVFGAFYFLFFFFLIFVGFYLIFKKKGLSLKVNLALLGFTLTFVGFLILASTSDDTLTIKNVFSLYNSQIGSISSGIFHIDSLTNVGLVGGGFIGFFLAALLNTAVTTIGTRVIVLIFIIAGLGLMLRRPIKFMLVHLKKATKNRKEKKAEKKKILETKALSEEDEEEDRNIAFDNDEESDVGQTATSDSPFTFMSSKNKNNVVPPPAIVEPEPVIEEPIEEPIDKEEYIVDEEEVKTPHPMNPFANMLRKEEEEEEIIQEEEDDEDDDMTVILERKERKASPLEKSYGNSSAQQNVQSPVTPPTPPENDILQTEFIVDDKPRQVSPPSIKRRYILPSVQMLSDHKDIGKFEQNAQVAKERTELINSVFNDFHVKASVISYTIGPSVTRYNVRTEPGVRVNALSNLVDEIQVRLKGDKSVRIETVVQGRDTSGIEVGNPFPMTVSFKHVFSALESDDRLVVPLGQEITGEVAKVSIDSLPHLLVAGTTGSGKSVFIHSIIMALIMRNYPEQLKLILIDPKTVEFKKYENLPHLYCPIITQPDLATAALYKLVSEMERRYTLLARHEVVNVKQYRKIQATREDMEVLPDIVVIVDEFADLISNNAKEMEPLIQRIAQKARAAGIYLIVATQRPSVNVITGDIKANIPARVALSVSSAIDSRTILDEVGAETLLGRGDLLARKPGTKFLVRVQSAYVDDDEIVNVVRYLKQQEKPQFNPDFLNLELREDENGNLSPASRGDARKKGSQDEYYEEIKRYVIESGTASTSALMRHYGLGYGRAASILDSLEDEGIIKTISNGRKTVLRKPDSYLEGE